MSNMRTSFEYFILRINVTIVLLLIKTYLIEMVLVVLMVLMVLIRATLPILFHHKNDVALTKSQLFAVFAIASCPST